MTTEQLDALYAALARLEGKVDSAYAMLEEVRSQQGALDERCTRIEAIVGNHAIATGEDIRALTSAIHSLSDEVLAHRSDIAALKGDTDPCPNDGPLPPNGEAA